MITSRWLICERTGRWAAALRIALEQRPFGDRHAPVTLDEVRTLHDCASKLRETTRSLGFVEVKPRNLIHALAWLAEVSILHRRCAFVALLDYQFPTADIANSAATQGAVTSEIIAALREAGAADVVLSPRQLTSVLPQMLDLRPLTTLPPFAGPEPGQSVEAWAWSLLPWQDAGRPVG
jgi:hypothetical protein